MNDSQAPCWVADGRFAAHGFEARADLTINLFASRVNVSESEYER